MCVKHAATYSSKIDHFVVSNNVCNNVVKCVINGEYCSDHAAVKATLSIAVPHKAINSQSSVFINKLAWQWASEENINIIKNIVDDC